MCDSFQEEKEIVAMMDLRMAYEGNDLAKFERTLHDKRNKITDDPFVMTYLDPLRQRIRESVLLHMCRPYKKITLKFMAGVRKDDFDECFLLSGKLLLTINFTSLCYAFVLRPEGRYDIVPGGSERVNEDSQLQPSAFNLQPLLVLAQ